MFPLPILPLPGEMVQLHVFEPRYQMLFDELEGMDLEEFGIPFSKQNNLAGVGSVMRLVTVREKQQDGSRDVVVTSTGLFQLESFEEFPEVQPYPNGRCNPLEEWREWPLGEACERAKQALFKVMKDQGISTTKLENVGLVRFVQHLGIDAAQRAEILASKDIHTMQSMVLERIELTRKLLVQNPTQNGGLFMN